MCDWVNVTNIKKHFEFSVRVQKYYTSTSTFVESLDFLLQPEAGPPDSNLRQCSFVCVNMNAHTSTLTMNQNCTQT